MTYRISDPSTFTRSTPVRMFHGKSDVAPAVATVPAVLVRKIRRTLRRNCPALTCPPPGVCDAPVVRLVVAPTLFFSAYRLVASWNGLPPPPAPSAPPPPPAAAPCAISHAPVSTGWTWLCRDAASSGSATPSGGTARRATACRISERSGRHADQPEHQSPRPPDANESPDRQSPDRACLSGLDQDGTTSSWLRRIWARIPLVMSATITRYDSPRTSGDRHITDWPQRPHRRCSSRTVPYVIRVPTMFPRHTRPDVSRESTYTGHAPAASTQISDGPTCQSPRTMLTLAGSFASPISGRVTRTARGYPACGSRTRGPCPRCSRAPARPRSPCDSRDGRLSRTRTSGAPPVPPARGAGCPRARTAHRGHARRTHVCTWRNRGGHNQTSSTRSRGRHPHPGL